MEVWKSVKGYEGLYEISNQGRLKGLEKIRIIGYGGTRIYPETIFTPTPNTKGYCVCVLRDHGKSKTFSIHRLVAEHFLERLDCKNSVNHKNGIKSDNRVENLEWCTVKENNDHAKETGLLAFGEKNPNSKISEIEAIKILSLKGKKSAKELSSRYGITKESIWNIWKKASWSHI